MRLGQHFLKNKSKLRKIAEALELKSGDTVIEIGPGHGELTGELTLKQGMGLSPKRIENEELRIIAIEKDHRLAQDLRNTIETQWKFNRDTIEIVEGDALKMLPSLIQNSKLRIKNFKVVGNIPYYITGYLFRILGELENKPEVIVLTIQKEVAERVCARPPNMNLLAVSVQFWAEPKIIGYISKKDFKPQPKVDSAIIKLTLKQGMGLSPKRIKNEELTLRGFAAGELRIKDDYYKLIKIIFKQPRKTIWNNLVEADLPRIAEQGSLRGERGLERGSTQMKKELIEILLGIGVNPNDRPQNLSIKQIITLSKNHTV